ncbi:hypothetical protein ACFQ1S_13770, partial [Kibdelosporangium lantanae]
MNFTPTSSADVSFADGVCGTAESGKIPHGHCLGTTVTFLVTAFDRFAESSTARTDRVTAPECAGVNVYVQVELSGPQLAGCQVVPSTETSTPATRPPRSVT